MWLGLSFGLGARATEATDDRVVPIYSLSEPQNHDPTLYA